MCSWSEERLRVKTGHQSIKDEHRSNKDEHRSPIKDIKTQLCQTSWGPIKDIDTAVLPGPKARCSPSNNRQGADSVYERPMERPPPTTMSLLIGRNQSAIGPA